MYILEHNGDFYENHIIATPKWRKYLIRPLGFLLRPFRLLCDRQFTYSEYRGSKLFLYRMKLVELLMTVDSWYSRGDVDAIKQAVLSGAITTIDALNEKVSKK